MAEQLAENYHNTWGRKKKQELEAKGEAAIRPCTDPLHRGPLVTGSAGCSRVTLHNCFHPLKLGFCVCAMGIMTAFATLGL